MNRHPFSLGLLLSLTIAPAPAIADVPYPAELIPPPQSYGAYDAAITSDAADGLLTVARLTTPAASRVPFNFGAVSGDATMEFILEGNPAAIPAGGYLAVGSNTISNLRYEQWQNTGQLGFTQLGHTDYLFVPGVPSPTVPTHVAFAWEAATLTMRLYVNGALAGTRSGVTAAFAMPTGQGWLGGNPAGGELMVGTIHRVTVYDELVAPEVIQRHANVFNGVEARLANPLPFQLNAFDTRVAINGDRAVATIDQRADLFVRENGTWRYQGSLTGPPFARGNPVFRGVLRVALEGDTLVLGDPDAITDFGPFTSVTGGAYAYTRSPGPGLNAWNVTDGDSSTSSAQYAVGVPPEMDAAAFANGWRYRLVARFVKGFNTVESSMIFLYGDGTNRFGAFFDLNTSGNLVARLMGVAQERVLTTNGVGATDYHTHELVFNPVTRTATYFFDGVSNHTWTGQSQINNGIFWGAGSTAGQGAMNVHQARFEILGTGAVLADYNAGTEGNPPMAPDPLSQGWSLSNPPGPNSPVGPQSPDPATIWRLQAALVRGDSTAGTRFGESLALSGNTVVVGAPTDDVGGTDTGSVYVFTRNGTNWTQQQKLAPSPRAASDRFGWSVDIAGDSIVAGAPSATGTGRAFVFARTGATWSQQPPGAALTPAGGASGDAFGYAVAIDGDRVAVGAQLDDHPGAANAGSAYVFERAGGVWTQRTNLTANPINSAGQFGNSIDLKGDTIIVGAYETGAHYIFVGGGGNQWVQANRRVYTDNPDPGVASVAFDGQRFMVGTIEIEGSGGAAHIFSADYNNAAALATYARKMLYYPDAQSAAIPFNRNFAAFRYKHLLYGQTNGQVRARFENMAALYGPAERALAASVEAELLKGFLFDPDNAALGHLLLDLCYDRTVAETILAKDLVARLERATMDPPTNGFAIDNELALYPQLLATNRFALQCYFDLLQRELVFAPPSGTQPRWATSVLGFSSEWEPLVASWNAIQALGPPDTYPNHGDIETAWASATADDQREFLELGYPSPAPVNLVSIYETLSPGAVDKVSVHNATTGKWKEVWSGAAASAGSTARIFTVTFPLTAFPVDGIRLDLNSTNVPGWNEIDAVSVIALPVVDSTFGHRLFQQLVPGRGLAPATYTNAGMNVVVTTNTISLTNGMLYAGYKDLVLLFDLMREYGDNAAAYARLLIGRDNPGDRAAAQTLITEAQQFLFLQGSLLKNVFPVLPPKGDPSGIAESIAGWSAALGDLEHTGALLLGGVNLLGFSDDFLMLIQKFQGQNPELYDSFNSLKDWLDPDASSRHLRYAVDRLAAARTAYATFRGFEDETLEQFDQSTVSYEFRLFEIAGARPGEDAYATPQNNAGSDIQQQMQSIEVARIRIARNQTEIDNLYRRMEIELTKAADLQEVAIRYGNQQAQLTEEIGHINAAQAAAQAYADAFSIEKLNPANIFFNSVNAGVQTGGELGKAQKEAQKERLAAAEQTEIIGIEAQATVKQLWLNMRTAVLDSQEAVLLMQQEVGRLAALLREKADLERRLADRDTSLSSRYFADPVHRLRAGYETQMAKYAFDEAQRWLFYMARALEYKWNQPFTHLFEGRSWNGRSIFKLRNADELLSFYRAMDDFDAGLEGTRIKEEFFDWFSVREDFFGYRLRDDNGQLLSYPDPISGQSVDAITAFRSRLRQALDVQNQIRLNFHTVRQIPGGTFFRSARYLPDGEVDPAQRGLYLDKIYWMKIRLPGRHNPNRNRTFITGSLTQAGTSYLRNELPGYFDPLRPDRMVDEMTPYSTRYWFLSNARTNNLPGIPSLPPRWMFREGLSHPAAQMWLTDQPRQNGVPGDPDPQPEVQQIDAFKERSVAASDWRLILPTRDLGTTILSIDEMDDIELYFYHYAVIRP